MEKHEILQDETQIDKIVDNEWEDFSDVELPEIPPNIILGEN